MRALPAERYDLSVWAKAIVNIDYDVQVDESFYSVPYTLAQKTVEVRTTPTTIAVFYQGSRVSSHVPARKPNTAVTLGRAPAQGAPGMFTVATVATARLGAKDWSLRSATVPPDSGPLPAPGNGLPLLPGVAAIGREVRPEAAGVGQRAVACDRRRQLQECEIDLGKLARSAADSSRAGAAAWDWAR